MSILDDLPGILADAAGDVLFKDAVYEVDGPATGPTYDPQPGPTVRYPCKALSDTYSAYSRSGGLVAASDRKILILAATLATQPVEGGRVLVDGLTYRIGSDGGSAPAVSTDPAKAVWTCRGRT